jgi:hypothetical protein
MSTPTRITREQKVQASLIAYLDDKLFNVLGYPRDQVELVEAFEHSRFEGDEELDNNYIALGFNFDDGGRPAELGSTLITRTYTMEVWVMALTPAIGLNLANAVRDEAEADMVIPLLDIAQAGEPVIDQLIVGQCRAQRQPVAQPKPWQENLWIVYIPLTDEYYSPTVSASP